MGHERVGEMDDGVRTRGTNRQPAAPRENQRDQVITFTRISLNN